MHPIVNRVSTWNRRRKWRLFLDTVRPTEATTVLDVGYTDRELGLPGANYVEKHYEWPHKIVALGIEDPTEFQNTYPDVKVVVYDGREWPFSDQSFDVVWSNAVIEHVGSRENQLLFLSEAARVGKQLIITTPNRFFPLELHTRLPLLHWLPKSVFDRILPRLGKGWAAGAYMRLLSTRDLRKLMAEAGVEGRIVKTRMGGFTMDQVSVGRSSRVS